MNRRTFRARYGEKLRLCFLLSTPFRDCLLDARYGSLAIWTRAEYGGVSLVGKWLVSIFTGLAIAAWSVAQGLPGPVVVTIGLVVCVCVLAALNQYESWNQKRAARLPAERKPGPVIRAEKTIQSRDQWPEMAETPQSSQQRGVAIEIKGRPAEPKIDPETGIQRLVVMYAVVESSTPETVQGFRLEVTDVLIQRERIEGRTQFVHEAPPFEPIRLTQAPPMLFPRDAKNILLAQDLGTRFRIGDQMSKNQEGVWGVEIGAHSYNQELLTKTVYFSWSPRYGFRARGNLKQQDPGTSGSLTQ